MDLKSALKPRQPAGKKPAVEQRTEEKASFLDVKLKRTRRVVHEEESSGIAAKLKPVTKNEDDLSEASGSDLDSIRSASLDPFLRKGVEKRRDSLVSHSAFSSASILLYCMTVSPLPK